MTRAIPVARDDAWDRLARDMRAGCTPTFGQFALACSVVKAFVQSRPEQAAAELWELLAQTEEVAGV